MASPPDDDDDDATVWRHVIATVRPLPGRPPAAPGLPPRRTSGLAVPTASAPARLAGSGGADLDGRTADRLRRGLLPIDGRLDLHGLTQEAAHRRLIDFIRRGHAGRRRCLLVITGKGAAKKQELWYVAERGVLRARIPEWLATPEIAPLVLRIQPAQLRHGGDGAFYILLRRRRD